MAKSCRCLILLVLGLTTNLSGQSITIVSADSVGMDSSRLTRIESMVKRHVDSDRIVGATWLVARRGHIVEFDSHGHADVDADKPIRTDTIFRIYSMTKPITSVAAMMLYEEGKFQLFDPIGKYLPELKNLEVYVDDGTDDGGREKARRPVSVADLLCHRGGFTYGFFGGSPVDRLYQRTNVLDNNLEEMVTDLSTLPLLAHPGERFQYSVSTDILGRLVEVWSGKDLRTFFKDRIFTPLDMHDTDFMVSEEKLDRFSVNYRWGNGKRFVADDPETSRYRKLPTFLSGGGGLVSTTSDYYQFCQMMLNGGELKGRRLLGAKTVSMMTTDHLEFAEKPTTGVTLGGGAGFGLGFRVVNNPSQNERMVSRGTFSWGGMASTCFFVDPQEELIGILMTQKFPTDMRIRDEFQTAVYQAITELKK